tara:strand:- start:178 stop:522 length:345 start_codon:yes stop_codon:yes gene_type:complete
MLLFFVIISCGPVSIGVKDIPLQSKEIKGYDIKFYAKRDKYGINCQAYLSINRKNSDLNELYVEIQALDKNSKLLSVAYFLIKDLKNNEIIEETRSFKGIESCAKIERLEVLGG